MKKFRVAFVVIMLMIMVLTACVMGATPTENVRGSEYHYSKTGGRAVFNANGNKSSSTSTSATSTAYTTMYNPTVSTYSMSAYIGEYVYDTGWTNSKTNRINVEPGRIVDSENLTRYYNSSIRYYYHVGSVYTASGSSTVIESYDYIANQYY